MTADWLMVIVPLILALILIFVLGAFKLADRADRKAERILRDLREEAAFAAMWGDQHPHRSDR